MRSVLQWYLLLGLSSDTHQNCGCCVWFLVLNCGQACLASTDTQPNSPGISHSDDDRLQSLKERCESFWIDNLARSRTRSPEDNTRLAALQWFEYFAVSIAISSLIWLWQFKNVQKWQSKIVQKWQSKIVQFWIFWRYGSFKITPVIFNLILACAPFFKEYSREILTRFCLLIIRSLCRIFDSVFWRILKSKMNALQTRFG